jgi:hypothetical protein
VVHTSRKAYLSTLQELHHQSPARIAPRGKFAGRPPLPESTCSKRQESPRSHWPFWKAKQVLSRPPPRVLRLCSKRQESPRLHSPR